MKTPLPPAERARLLREGCRLLSEGRYFEAHEAFEDLWNSTDRPAEREVWQGLAQVSAALVKHDRGEPATAISLLSKATRRLEGASLLTTHRLEIKAWLDGLAGPLTREMDLPGAALPDQVAGILGDLLPGPGAAGDPPDGGGAPPGALS